MICYQPHGKFLIQYLVVFIIIPLVVCDNFWNFTVATPGTKKYVAAVVTRKASSQYSRYCQGAVLNSRYVLTARNCFQYGDEAVKLADITVFVGYTHVGPFSYASFLGNGGEYKASAVYNIVSLTLIRTNTWIKFNEKVRCINLPTRWQFPSGIPDYGRVDSSFWCKNTGTEVYYLYYKWGFRNCTYSEISSFSEWYIPICLEEKTPNNCWYSRGTPLVYNNTLVGIRNYAGSRVLKPQNFKGELFINVARHVNEINEIMYYYDRCTE